MKSIDSRPLFTNNCKIYFETSLDVAGYSYLVIFGHHINGGFICIPNWQVSCEASDHLHDKEYNTSRLMSAGVVLPVAEAIAEYIEGFLLERRHERTKESSHLSFHRSI